MWTKIPSPTQANLIKKFIQHLVARLLVAVPSYLGLYSLNGRTPYRKISCEVSKPRDSCLDFPNRSEIWQASRQQRYLDAYQIAERHDHYNIQFRGFETSRDLAVRRFK